jgi:hypothetical protein
LGGAVTVKRAEAHAAASEAEPFDQRGQRDQVVEAPLQLANPLQRCTAQLGVANVDH